MLYTKNDIFKQLTLLSVPQDRIVMVHSSLRAVGKVEGGAEMLLDALVSHVTAKGGLLCIPTHTWHNLGKDITLDLTKNEHCMGALATVALKDARGIRSENPTHSLVVFGDKAQAEEFISNEPFVKTSTAKEGCYGKLFYRDGCVLLLGVAQNKNTYLHAVDEILNVPNRMDTKATPVSVKRKDGTVIKKEIGLYYTDYTEDISERFVKYDTAFRYHRCIRDGFIGDAPVQLCNAKKMKETIELILKQSGGEDPLFGEAPIPQKWYCIK
ncbi:MAG: AAC(3) family N-acetyltransferase [Clostridia bacterium]|nr:AAC(3) family N-acetyltransferase [Clostridia bacterium]